MTHAQKSGDGERYAPGNTRADGSYKVGKGRPPDHSKFRADDGRPRGRRPKGQRNFDTEFEEEARRRVTVREDGKQRKVSKLRGTIIRTFDSAFAKGDARAQNLVFSHAARIGDRRVSQPDSRSPDDAELDAWLRDRLSLLDQIELQSAGDSDPACSTESEEPRNGD